MKVFSKGNRNWDDFFEKNHAFDGGLQVKNSLQVFFGVGADSKALHPQTHFSPSVV